MPAPEESPEALVHMEIAKLYGEVVLLPELKPNEDPEVGRAGVTCCMYGTCGGPRIR